MAAPRATAETALVTLRLDLGTETIRGTLTDDRNRERPFWGWLELSGALDESRGIDRIRVRERPSARTRRIG
jgi:hypothetical protein